MWHRKYFKTVRINQTKPSSSGIIVFRLWINSTLLRASAGFSLGHSSCILAALPVSKREDCSRGTPLICWHHRRHNPDASTKASHYYSSGCAWSAEARGVIRHRVGAKVHKTLQHTTQTPNNMLCKSSSILQEHGHGVIMLSRFN